MKIKSNTKVQGTETIVFLFSTPTFKHETVYLTITYQVIDIKRSFIATYCEQHTVTEIYLVQVWQSPSI